LNHIWLKGTLTQNILAFFIIFNIKSVFFSVRWRFFNFSFALSFYIWILNFNLHLAKCFIICSSFTEHAWTSFKRVYWTRLNIVNVISEHACVLYACSLNMLENSNISSHFQACSENVWNCPSVFRESSPACLVISCKLWSILLDED
jgi:hypothetical protein